MTGNASAHGSRVCYAGAVDPKAIREFVSRPWELVEHEKARALEERFEREGTTMGLEVLAELRQRLRAQNARPALEISRAEDLDAHLRWVGKLARVRDGLARR